MHLDHRPVRGEGVFNKDGAYSLIVEHNILLHQEAVRVCTKVVADWLANRSTAMLIRVLDLACGGMPVVMNGVMRQFVIHRFDYHGVDVDADQIRTAREFRLSPNVRATFSEGDCWQPGRRIRHPVDIVFVGLNTHHAIPEELQNFTHQLKKMMTPGGLFLNYDFFRPPQYPYLRRPDRATPLMSHDWRKKFITPYIAIMKRHHFSKSMIDETIAHVTARDYPVSADEMCSLLKGEGFKAQAIPFDSGSPLTPFFNVVAATL